MGNVCIEKAENTCRSYPRCFGCNAFQHPTNYYKILSMRVDEMAEFLAHFVDGYHTPAQNRQRRRDMIEWLESEAE